MSFILNIDTAAAVAAVSIASNGKLLQLIQNDQQKEHASFLQPAIKKLLLQLNMSLKDIDAVAVVNGPGSYTGLRVGLASAKGICYALNKPLITIGSLLLMSKSAIISLKKENLKVPLLCPMIDARRMEVFTAIYDEALNETLPAQAIILNHNSFVAFLLQYKVLFFGDGAAKFKPLIDNANALFAVVYDNFEALCEVSFYKFTAKEFTDITYSEPLYLKEFYKG